MMHERPIKWSALRDHCYRSLSDAFHHGRHGFHITVKRNFPRQKADMKRVYTPVTVMIKSIGDLPLHNKPKWRMAVDATGWMDRRTLKDSTNIPSSSSALTLSPGPRCPRVLFALECEEPHQSVPAFANKPLEAISQRHEKI